MKLNKGTDMLYWAAVCFMFSLISAVIGFTGIAGDAGGNVAKIMFFVLLVLGALSLIFARRPE